MHYGTVLNQISLNHNTPSHQVLKDTYKKLRLNSNFFLNRALANRIQSGCLNANAIFNAKYSTPPHFQFLLNPRNCKSHYVCLAALALLDQMSVASSSIFMHSLNATIRPVEHYSMNNTHHPCRKIAWLLVCEIERLEQGSANWNCAFLLMTVKTLPGWEIAQFHVWKLASASFSTLEIVDPSFFQMSLQIQSCTFFHATKLLTRMAFADSDVFFSWDPEQ